jgi:phage I-like protein
MKRTGSLFLSLNFEGGIPSRIELVPAAAIVAGRDGRKWKNSKPKQVALNSNARLPSLPIDENHSTDLAAPKGGASPAFGWMSNLIADENGAIWADVEWTEKGRDALNKKEYRYISPVFYSDEQGEINCIGRAYQYPKSAITGAQQRTAGKHNYGGFYGQRIVRGIRTGRNRDRERCACRNRKIENGAERSAEY